MSETECDRVRERAENWAGNCLACLCCKVLLGTAPKFGLGQTHEMGYEQELSARAVCQVAPPRGSQLQFVNNIIVCSAALEDSTVQGSSIACDRRLATSDWD